MIQPKFQADQSGSIAVLFTTSDPVFLKYEWYYK
jgi:hypothetical protein